MFRLPFKIKWTRRRCDFALDFAEVVGVGGEAHTRRYGVFGGVDHARSCLAVFEKERAIENNLAAQSTTVAFAFLVRLPAIQNLVR